MIVFALGLMTARADMQIWSTKTGDWFTVENWTNITIPENTRVPADGDDVVVTNLGALVYLTNATARLGSMVISNAYVSCSNWDTTLYVTNLTILKSGVLTCWGPFSNNVMSNRVCLNCTTLIIETNGSINVTDKGYSGGIGPGGDFYPDGNGPGAGGPTLNSGRMGGAGYGGVGVFGVSLDAPTNTYGSSTAPLDPGSGGSVYSSLNNKGGHGGGAVCITAVQIVVNGSISANSSEPSGYVGSGGSGGGIYITCSTITGTNGTITANGGNARINSTPVGGGGGGGGRIAVIYDHDAQNLLPVPSIRFSTASGISAGIASSPYLPADIGTLYFPDSYFFSPTNLFTGQWLAPIPAQVSISELVVSNVWARLPGFNLTVTNTLTVAGTNHALFKLEITNNTVISCGQIRLSGAALVLGYGYNTNASIPIMYAATSGPTLNCSGDLVLTNASRFYISAGLTNSGAETGYGARVSVNGNILVGTNCWILPAAHPTNGAATLFSTRNMTLDLGGGINADGRGYAGGIRPGTATVNTAYGAGCAAAFNGGSGYGGAGSTGFWGMGAGQGVPGGPAYGSSNAPLAPGSGARAGYSTPIDNYNGPYGGGSVQVRATDTIVVNGMISASAGAGGKYYGPGAAGGAIYITCRTFIGNSNGVLRANGGNSGYGPVFPGGGGGGGRIAVWRIFDNSPSVISNYVNGGGYYNNPTYSTGAPGSIVWGSLLPPNGTIVTIY